MLYACISFADADELRLFTYMPCSSAGFSKACICIYISLTATEHRPSVENADVRKNWQMTVLHDSVYCQLSCSNVVLIFGNDNQFLSNAVSLASRRSWTMFAAPLHWILCVLNESRQSV
jgi:hypothetical protein